MTQTEIALAALYELDETAWLDTMTELIRSGDLSNLDYVHLQEYLADMARRDRREVANRLARYLGQVLKWIHKPQQRTRSWRGKIVMQRFELADLAGRGVLRNHAEAFLREAYKRGVERTVIETGLPAETFPTDCPYSLDQLLTVDLTANAG